MQNDTPLAFRSVMTLWRVNLLEAMKRVRQEIFCISPYFTDDVIQGVEKTLLSLPQKDIRKLTIRILTRIRLDDFLTGASELEALERILARPTHMPNWEIELRAHEKIHEIGRASCRERV